MKRKHWLLVLSAMVLVTALGASIYLFANRTAIGLAQASEPNPTAIPQSVARSGELSISVSGAGRLVSASSSNLSFDATGTLLEINVAPGDLVQAGEILARLKVDKTPAQQQAELARAEMAVVQARQSLDQLLANADLASAQALNDLETSQAALDDLTHPELKQAQAMQAVAAAMQDVATAEMNLYILQSVPAQQAVDIANASLLFEQKVYQDLLGSIARLENQIKSASSPTARDRLEAQLVQMRISLAQQVIELETANNKIASMGDPPDPDRAALAQAQLAAAQAGLAQAQRSLATAQAGPTPADLAAAQSTLVQAQSAWEQLKDGPDPVALEKAQTTLAQAQAGLALAQQEKLVLDLAAPFTSTILSVSASPGDKVGKTGIISLADLSQPIIEVSLDETDMTSLQIGQQAEVVFDALPGETFSGDVVQIDPSLQQSLNTQTAIVWVRLDPQDARSALSLPLGLNASVDILVGTTNNAVIVSVDALHQLEDGTRVVYVIHDNQLEQRPVTLGLMDVTSAEITSGLQAGEIVATGTIKSMEGNP